MLIDCDIARSSSDGSRPTLRCLRRKQFPLKRIRLYSATKRVDGIYKLIDILKSLVHRGVTQIRHFIDAAQFFEHPGADDRRKNFAPARFKVMDNFIHHLFECEKTGRAFFKSFCDAGGELAPIERLMGSVTFHYTQVRALGFLIGGKAIFAVQTFAAAPDARTIPRLTGIDDLVITRPALGATHSVNKLISILFVVASMYL